MIRTIKTSVWAVFAILLFTMTDNFYGIEVTASANGSMVSQNQASSLILSETGLTAEQIEEIYAVEQAGLTVPVGVEISIPIVVETPLYYLLIKNTVSGTWDRYYFSRDQWNATIRPALESADANIEIAQQPRGTDVSITALQEAMQIAAEQELTGVQIANFLLHGSVNGPAGAPQAVPTPFAATASNASAGLVSQATIQNSDRIGTVGGNFRVDESGAATYSIPIMTAAGTAGTAPQVGLSYSSSAGNGIAGIGWSVGGVSKISRCRKTLHQDQTSSPILWTTEDALCLDGQRLISADGSVASGTLGATYQTEVDSGALIEITGFANGEPTSFSVKRRDGSTSIYGLAAGNSAQDALFKRTASASASSNKSSVLGVTQSWAIKRFEDNVGNPIWFEYLTDTLSQNIHHIKYGYGEARGGSDAASGYGAIVTFNYDNNRPDPISGYLGGHYFKNSKRLLSIDSKNKFSPGSGHADSTPGVMRTYKLNYLPTSSVDVLSRVESIEECVGTICKPPTQFNWRMPTNEVPSHSISNFNMSTGNNVLLAQAFGDINGDGKLDFAWMEANAASTIQPRIKYALSGGSTYSLTSFAQSGVTSTNINSSSPISTDQYMTAIDYNVDGRTDIAVYNHSQDLWRVYLSRPQTDGSWKLHVTSLSMGISDPEASFVDINGDGATDVVYDVSTGPFSSPVLKARLLERNSEDIDSYKAYSFSQERTISNVGGVIRGDLQSINGDFDGDGRSDLLNASKRLLYCEDFGDCYYEWDANIYVFTGEITDSTIYIKRYADLYEADGLQAGVHKYRAKRFQTIDANSDGLTDLYYQLESGASFIALNHGDGSFESTNLGDSSIAQNDENEGASTDGAKFVDWNSDGYADLVWHTLPDSGVSVAKIKYWDPVLNKYGSTQAFGGTTTSSPKISHFYSDINGDAVMDRVRIDASSGTHRVSVFSRAALIEQEVEAETYDGTEYTQTIYVFDGLLGQAPNKVDQITNGLGMVTSMTYEPLSATANYRRVNLANVLENTQQCYSEYEPGTPIICEDAQILVPDEASYYEKINGDWMLPDGTPSIPKSTPVLEYNSSMYVVTHVQSSAPSAAPSNPGVVNNDAMASVTYYYGEARIQAGGRGFLGFRILESVDNQNDVRTTGVYRQDWPFIGYPLSTTTYAPDGRMISRSTSDWTFLEYSQAARNSAQRDGTTTLGSVHPVMNRSVESKYDLIDGANGGDATVIPVSTIISDSQFDAVGNPHIITVTEKDGSGVIARTVTSVSQYFDNATFPLREARLKRSEVTTERPGYDDGSSLTNDTPITRVSEYTYYDGSGSAAAGFYDFRGLIKSETIEPGTPYASTSEHRYDKFGNRVFTSETAGGETRCAVATREFDTRGRYAWKNMDCLGRITGTADKRNVFGLATETLTKTGNGNGLKAVSQYSAFGMEYYQGDETGEHSVSYRSDSAADLANCPANTAYAAIAISAGGGRSSDCIDLLGRVTRSLTIGFDGAWDAQDTVYDIQSRVLRSSEPYDLPGAPAYWTTNTYDLQGRVVNSVAPNGALSRFDYRGLEVDTYNDKNQKRTEISNALGEIVQVVDHYGSTTNYLYTHTGALAVTTDPAGNQMRFGYDRIGRKLWSDDPDKGRWNYAYNPFGEMTRQIDAVGNITEMTYDSLGRIKTRIDRKVVDNSPGSGEFENPGIGDGSIGGAFGGGSGSGSGGGSGGFGGSIGGSSGSGTNSGSLGGSTGGIGGGKGGSTGNPDEGVQLGGNLEVTGDAVWHYDGAVNGQNRGHYIIDSVSGFRQESTYDSFGRPVETITKIDGENYRAKITYDQYGRVFQKFDTAGDGSYQDFGTVSSYNAYGYLKSVSDAVFVNGESRTVYSTVVAMNARGQVTQSEIADGLVDLTADHYEQTGFVRTLRAASSADGMVQDLSYDWDSIGNLKYRDEQSGTKDLHEAFQYDDLNRLTHQTVTGQQPTVVSYDLQSGGRLGNITSKSLIGDFIYGENGAGPHAVTRAGAITYEYDANGNNTSSSDGRTIDYTSFSKIESVTKDGHTTSFEYAPDRSRFKRLDNDAEGLTSTIYVGDIEIINRPDGTKEKKRHIGGLVVQTIYFGDNDIEDYRQDQYLLKDHLGSLDVILDSDGALYQEMSFDAWGKRRDASNWTPMDNIQISAFDNDVTTRGFTGHEMLDEVGIIHMNGRIYDPHLGRFLQADPAIQSLHDLQSLNRYSYGMNNPLNGSDPSGYFWNFVGYAIAAFAASAVATSLDIPILSSIASIAICGVSGGIGCAIATSFGSTLGAGGSFADALRSGLMAGLSSSAFSAIGDTFTQTTGFFKNGGIGHVATHAVTGGVFSVLQGGKFGHGFFSAGVTKAINLNNLIPGASSSRAIMRTLAAAVVGGTSSVLVGGKFANAAVTAAFAQAYNGNSFWRKAKELGATFVEFVESGALLEMAKEEIPGYSLYNCVKSGCSYFTWVTSVGEVAAIVLSGGTAAAAKGTAAFVKAVSAFKRFKAAKAARLKGGCCFAPGTPVLTEYGQVAIEDVQIGDLVLTKNMETNELELQPVTKLWITHGKELYSIDIEDASGITENLRVSENHPFWVEGEGWIESANLLPGMILVSSENQTARVLDVSKEGYSEDTYNFEVATNHNYFVGAQQVLVHNATECDILTAAERARDATAQSKGRKHATYAGGHKDGRVVSGCSSNPTGCAEEDIARQLGNDAEMTGAKGWRTNTETGNLEYKDIPVCVNCQSKFDRSQFPADVTFDPGGVWSE